MCLIYPATWNLKTSSAIRSGSMALWEELWWPPVRGACFRSWSHFGGNCVTLVVVLIKALYRFHVLQKHIWMLEIAFYHNKFSDFNVPPWKCDVTIQLVHYSCVSKWVFKGQWNLHLDLILVAFTTGELSGITSLWSCLGKLKMLLHLHICSFIVHSPLKMHFVVMHILKEILRCHHFKKRSLF